MYSMPVAGSAARARSLARPVTVLGEGGGLEWRGEIETEWAMEGRSDGQPNSHCGGGSLLNFSAVKRQRRIGGGAVAPAFGNDCDCSRFLIRNPMVLASERRKGIFGSKCRLAFLQGPHPASYYSVLFY